MPVSKPLLGKGGVHCTINETMRKNSEFEGRTFPIDNPDLCKTDSLLVFLWVQISVGDFRGRIYLRDHWLNVDLFRKPQLVVAYMVGLPKDNHTQNLLHLEAKAYGDIVQGNFVDSYHNQTLKNVAAIEWISKYCMNALYIIKTDSDVFINIVPIMEYLETTGISDNTFACKPLLHKPPLRDGKYKVSKKTFPTSIYPDYCGGVFYVHRTSMVRYYLHAAMITPYTVWIQDVFMTGLVRETMLDVTLTATPFDEWSTAVKSSHTEYTNCWSRITKYIIHRNDHRFQKDLDLVWAAALQRLTPSMKAKVKKPYLNKAAEKFHSCN